jgi:hypothetical protein
MYLVDALPWVDEAPFTIITHIGNGLMETIHFRTECVSTSTKTRGRSTVIIKKLILIQLVPLEKGGKRLTAAFRES